MKYKVGDKVKIRKDLNTSEMYGDWDCSLDMASYRGMIATITNCYDDSYHIDVDDERCDWTDEMFEDEDTKEEDTVSVGYYLHYCGHKVLENVYYEGIAEHDSNYIVFSNNDNCYMLPTDSIEFIVPYSHKYKED